MLLRGLAWFSFIICCSGGTSCGTSEASPALSRVRRSTFTFRYTPYCSTTSCLAQRALGFGLLGLAAFLGIYKYHHNRRSRVRREVTQTEELCSFLLLKPAEIFTNQYCYDSKRKMIIIQDEEYKVEEEITFPTDKFSILLKLTKPVAENHL